RRGGRPPRGRAGARAGDPGAHVRHAAVGAPAPTAPRRAHRRGPRGTWLQRRGDRRATTGRRALNATETVAGRARPVWLVATLTILTFGLYLPIWFGLTWSEMRRETEDTRMFPLGHALSTLVPGWNAWQAWRHF